MPVVGFPLDEFFGHLGTTLPTERLVDELHRFGCEIEGRLVVVRYRCARCAALSEAPEGEPAPSLCDGCGADLRGQNPAIAGKVETLKLDMLAVRPDLFDPPGLARAMAGFLGLKQGAPRYRIEPGDWTVAVDPALASAATHRPRIACATVHNVRFSEATLRSLMKLQEQIHWALGRDRKLASIGVYDLAQVQGPALRYRTIPRDGLRFVPLGGDRHRPDAALTPEQILAEHPKGKAFAWLLDGWPAVPLLQDGGGQVLSMPPIINSEATKVTGATTDLFVDVTGLNDRQIDRALAIIVTSLLESNPGASARSVGIQYGDQQRTTPDLAAQRVEFDPAAACRLLGITATESEVAGLLRRMRHDAESRSGRVVVDVPAFRSDVMHSRDLVEDLAIAYGYDQIPDRLETAATYGTPLPQAELATAARRALTGLGLLEVMTLQLTNEIATFERCGLPASDDFVQLAHPISVDQTMVRTSTIPGLLETLALNLGHPYPQRLFEVGHCTRLAAQHEAGAGEFLVAAVVLAGDGFGLADIRAVVDALLGELGRGNASRYRLEPSTARLFVPGRGAEIHAGAHWFGRFGEVHPAVLEAHRIIHPVAVMELRLEAL